VKLHFDSEDLAPLIREILTEVLDQVNADNAMVGKRLAIPEAEAARLLSMEPHQLRDERYDGRIKASMSRGGRIVYAKSDLIGYLNRRRWKPKR
jgi:hypothetical protein